MGGLIAVFGIVAVQANLCKTEGWAVSASKALTHQRTDR
jgi:hypothetical protein